MSDPQAPTPPPDAAEPPPVPAPAPQAPAARKERHLLRWIVVGAIALGVAIILFLIGVAFIPRWWAQRIGDQVDGSIPSGIGIGLFYGSVFTFLPLLALWLGFRKRRSWQAWTAWLVGAAALAFPNLLTLGIVVGQGDTAHDAERVLSVEAPSFRGASLVGAIAAAAVFLALQYVVFTRRRTKRLERDLREQMAERTREPAPPPAAEPPAGPPDA